jgi:hypothetical protein
MKYKHLFWSIILISIGMLFLLGNLGYIHFSWISFWKLWPVVLIIWGISILPIKDLFKFILLILTIVAAIFIFNRMPSHRPWYFDFDKEFSDKDFKDWDSENEDGTTYNLRDQNLSVPFDSLSNKGILRLDAAAGNFEIKDTTPDFLAFSKTGDIGNYELTTNDKSGVKEIALKMKEGTIRHKMNKNNVIIKLNNKPTWNLFFDIGAAAVDLNLSQYKVDTAEFDAGATSLNIKLGEKSAMTVLDFDASASSITVEVPRNSGCKVVSESVMASKEFADLEKVADHTYQSKGYAIAKNKVLINVNTAISKIRIERY